MSVTCGGTRLVFNPVCLWVLVGFLSGLRPRSVSGGFCTSRASGVLDSGSFLGPRWSCWLVWSGWLDFRLSFVLKPGRMNTVGHGVHYVVMSGRMGFASLPDSFLGSLEGYCQSPPFSFLIVPRGFGKTSQEHRVPTKIDEVFPHRHDGISVIMIATSPCVWTQMMRTNACPDSRSYYEMAKPKLICVEGYAFKTDRLGISDVYQSEVKDRHEHEHEHEKKGYRAFKHLNFQAQQAVSPSRWVGPKAHQESRLGYGYNKNKFLVIIQDYWLSTAKRVLGVVSQDLVALLPFGGQTLLWLTPSLQVGTLFLLEVWLFTVDGLVYLLLVVKVQSARSSKNILQSRACLFR
ncbi:hypothetical protein PHYBLDRAFT_169575 [Phycomyces blakesleeanus NRRL 1555(-)]|uniref:Uncharacterized protein n=1 Tax=Phycomyces blakesleeanus (strain ATCC 8743b / DSM 1359 / FGSC 10004 / NBRC 33097 / NRRL 1555) TaxID=763407 RepID=A0A162N9T1_PHYB8|nr:hypothetical protein PHYBLDRAFT_169575 [Phycomyces blakesleeanus NRRL 1555(-)]OAD72448.1 hypothetical protein PHYBLDRAFT_169575 [Phycomyces blakesleeanus NRRL 1555(-)]|eukprot:XP_018290488.1 hypothetical protein PHYBLDRAFT_169575 [Phycomyces blakesleeanus NRRL 1555(-)]